MTMTPRERDVLTVPEVAEYLRVTTKTVYALIQRGDLASFRVGRVLRCLRSDVQNFIDSRTRETMTAGRNT